MNILGICNLENSSAALICDGHVVAACEEERLSRVKHHRGFPLRSVEYCLRQGGLSICDVDAVAIGWVPWQGVTHRIASTLRLVMKNRGLSNKLDRGGSYFRIIWEQLRAGKLISDQWDEPSRFRVHYMNHHQCHMASSYFTSPFSESAMMSIDGTGEYETCVLGKCERGRFQRLARVAYPHSVGHLYTVFTSFLGFRPNSGEGKTMALAAYGEPVYESAIKSLCHLDEASGAFTCDLRRVDYSGALRRSFPQPFASVFGEPREPDGEIEDRHRDIAASIQKVLEDIIIKQARLLSRMTHTENLCLSGGVALNCLANARLIEQTGFGRIHVPSAPTDAGVSLGAALALHFRAAGYRPDVNAASPFLGPEYSSSQCLSAARRHGTAFMEVEDPERQAAQLLAQGNIVGWFQGRMEFGPRALGARSILAPPAPASMKDELNGKVKFREGFRPFAPAVLAEAVPDWFEDHGDSPNMSFAFRVKLHRAREIPAVTHVNGRSRLQTVTGPMAPRLYRLLEHFRDLTGIPILLNTSFNVAGEPIVCTPDDALKCFRKTDMDYLLLGNYLVARNRSKLPPTASFRYSPAGKSRCAPA
jgi:carbamoyltransferase